MDWNVTCVILAGGESRRMGQDKALMQVNGIRLFDYVYGTCHDLFPEIIIVTNQPQHFSEYHTKIFRDEIPGAGSLGGLYTGLVKAGNNHVFCVGCDMPFLKPELIFHLVAKRSDYDVIIPMIEGKLEPLHAVYSKRCIEPIRRLLKRGELKISKLLEEVQVGYCGENEIKAIDPSLMSFINVNTKKDLLQIERMLQGDQWARQPKAL